MRIQNASRKNAFTPFSSFFFQVKSVNVFGSQGIKALAVQELI